MRLMVWPAGKSPVVVQRRLSRSMFPNVTYPLARSTRAVRIQRISLLFVSKQRSGRIHAAWLVANFINGIYAPHRQDHVKVGVGAADVFLEVEDKKGGSFDALPRRRLRFTVVVIPMAANAREFSLSRKIVTDRERG